MDNTYSSATYATPGMVEEHFTRILHGDPAPKVAAKPYLNGSTTMIGNPFDVGYSRMLPTAFIFCCFVIFATPMALTIALGYDSSVQYWIGPWGLMSFGVPVLFAAGHLVHLERGFPRKPVVLLCTLFPAILFLIIGDIHLSVAYDLSDQLFSTDCDTFDSKRVLDRSWKRAHELYVKCITKTVENSGGKHNITIAKAFDLYRIHHCEEYETAHREEKEQWDYLRHLEENHHCSGWCESGSRRLWTYKGVRDPCSTAVGTVLKFKVQRIAMQVVVYSVCVIVLVTVVLVLVGPMIRAAGMPW